MADVNFQVTPAPGMYVAPVDDTLSVRGAAADAAKTGSEIAAAIETMATAMQGSVSTLQASINDNKASGDNAMSAMNERVSLIEEWKSALMGVLHPVGSVWMTFGEQDPGELFGGTWERIPGRHFLMNAGEDDVLGAVGGAEEHVHGTKEHVLTVEELPEHDHGTRRIMGAFGLTDSQQLQRLKADTAQDFVVCPELTDSETGEPMENALSKGYLHAEGAQVKRYYSGHTSLASAVHTGADAVVMDATHTHDAVGSGAAHHHGETEEASSMPPYVAVAIWRRVS